MDKKDALLSQVREAFGRVAYTHKTHEKMADSLDLRAFCFDWAEIVLIAAGSLTAVFGDGACAKILAGSLGALALFVAVYQLKFKPSVQADVHRQTARKLWFIREKYTSLITDTMSGTIAPDDGRKHRDEILVELKGIYDSAPSTSGRAYRAAQKALKFNEELSFSDAELDALLPPNLRKLP